MALRRLLRDRISMLSGQENEECILYENIYYVEAKHLIDGLNDYRLVEPETWKDGRNIPGKRHFVKAEYFDTVKGIASMAIDGDSVEMVLRDPTTLYLCNGYLLDFDPRE